MLNFRNTITKLQNLPEHQKKIIAITVVGIVALVLGYFWIKSAIQVWSNIHPQDLIPTNR